MYLIRWQDDYLVGDSTIDTDHQALFGLINEFYDALEQSHTPEDLARILTRLLNYAAGHFQREEKIMAEYGFPEVEEHLKEHQELYETIDALRRRLEDDAAPLDHVAIGFLKHWLVDHIVQHGLALGAYIRAENAAAVA